MNKNKKGFALLYSLLLTGAVLAVGVILMNIITKQLIFSSVNRSSEASYYYAANSGRECLDYYAGGNQASFYKVIRRGGVKDVVFQPKRTFECLGEEISLVKTSEAGNKYTYTLEEGAPISIDSNTKVNLTVIFNKECILHPDESGYCNGENLEDRSRVVMKAAGFSGNLAGDRSAQRVAIGVVVN